MFSFAVYIMEEQILHEKQLELGISESYAVFPTNMDTNILL